MTAREKRARAAELRAAGLEYWRIAAVLGVSRSTVYRWVNPAKVAGYEKRRRPGKRAWEQRHRAAQRKAAS